MKRVHARFLPTFRSESGAIQIMTALLLTTVMLSMGLAAISFTAQLGKQQGQSRRKSEARGALDAAIRMAAGWYANQAGCDPAAMNELLNGLCPDGSLTGPGSTVGCKNRTLTVTLGRQSYTVSFGAVRPLDWDTSDTDFVRRDGRDPKFPIESPATLGMTTAGFARGSTEDVVIEVSTQFGNISQTATPDQIKLNQRFIRKAVLLNTCAYSCTYLGNDSYKSSALTPDPAPLPAPPLPCVIRNNRAVGLARVSDAYPAIKHPIWGTTLAICEGDRPLGDVNIPSTKTQTGTPPPVGRGYVDLSDVWVLRSYLRSGETTLWNQGLIQGVAGSSYRACGDLNLDGEVTEADLGLLEKRLRGYLLWLPPVWGTFNATP